MYSWNLYLWESLFCVGRCLGYFSIAVLKHQGQGGLWTKVYEGSWFQRVRPPAITVVSLTASWQMQHWSRNWKLTSHPRNTRQRANWEWWSPVPVIQLLQKGQSPQSFPKVSTNWGPSIQTDEPAEAMLIQTTAVGTCFISLSWAFSALYSLSSTGLHFSSAAVWSMEIPKSLPGLMSRFKVSRPHQPYSFDPLYHLDVLTPVEMRKLLYQVICTRPKISKSQRQDIGLVL